MIEKLRAPKKPTVSGFLKGIQESQKRADARVLVKIMQEVTGLKPAMWSGGIVGFGRYHYKYASGREGDMPITGFSPRKQALTLYLMSGFDRHRDLLGKLGRYRTGVACLYIKRLEDVDLPTLKKLIASEVNIIRTEGYGTAR